MFYKNVKVDTPSGKGVKILKKGYVYFCTKVWWDKETGHSKDNRLLIGKIDEGNNNLMFPNDHYYEMFPNSKLLEEVPTIDNYLHIGQYLALRKASEIYGLYDNLRKNFPKLYNKIFALAIFAIDNQDNISQHFEKWAFSNYCGLENNLSSGQISEIYSSIKQEDIESFFKDNIKSYQTYNKTIDRKLIAYDSTNQNTYSNNISYAEYGHAKINEGLPCINTALFVDEITGIPLYYEHFYGSLLDKVQNKFTITKSKELGFKKLFFMMDRGYFSKENIDLLDEEEFGMMCPETTEAVKTMIKNNSYKIKNKENAYIDGYDIYGYTEKNTLFFNHEYDVYLYYDSKRAQDEIDTIHTKIDLMIKRLKTVKYYSKELKEAYEPFIIIEKVGLNKRSGFTYRKNDNAIQEEINKAGLFVILGNSSLSTKEMIEIARARDTGEKAFKRIKSNFDLSKTYAHNQNVYYGKMFVSFIALSIVETYRHFIKNYLNSISSITTYTSLSELSKLIIYKDINSTNWKQRYALTKKVKSILSLLNIDQNFINDFISKI